MDYKSEQTILKIIKYTPPLFIISVSILIIFFLYTEYKNTFDKEQKAIEKEFIEINKKRVKQNVDTVYNTILELQKNTEKELKNSIKQRVYEAYTIATRIYNENKDKDKKTITKMIKDALVDIRFNNGRGYYYIYSLDYECVLFPLNRKIEGSSFYNFQDSKGKYLTRDIISQVKKQNEGFMSWHFYKPNDKKNYYRKVGFNIYFKPLNWFIGTGEYLDDFEEDVKTKALEYVKTLRYINNNYIFVLDYNGTYLQHIKDNLIGKNALLNTNSKNSAKDVKNSSDVIEKAFAIAKNKGSGFISYIQNEKFKTKKSIRKTSYVKGIEPWGWMIGQGFYDDDFKAMLQEKKDDLEDKFKEYIFNILFVGISLMVVLLGISIYISKILKNKFDKYKEEIKKQLEENNRQKDVLAQQSKMSAMGEMIGNIAHQWRQPLSVISIISTSYKLKKELNKDIVFDTLIDDMDKVNENAQYLSRTIEDFRNFIRGSSNIKEFNLKKDISQFLHLIDGSMKNNDIEVILEDLDDNVIVKGFPNELIQCLINIFNNSKDAFIENKIEQRYIILSEIVQKDKIKIIVRDNAGGIPEEVLPKIFEPYFTTKHQSQGTGIGLHMTYKLIVEGMKGEIEANNVSFDFKGRKYKGVDFIIELPLY